VIGEPPVEDAVNVIVASPFPPLATILVGALGVVAGVTELLVPDGVLVPMAFVAITVKVYVVPFVSPVTVIGLPVEVAKAPEFAVTV
jgi:hypothetical protein